tara:strand:- start:41 stop:541 length:501 start_codon:yes stop_codon:yes gene_type:complete
MNSNVRVNNKLENISKKLDKKGMNQISNISYNAKDLSGNQYRVKSEFGEFIENNQDVLLLTTVEAIITFKNSEVVKIISKKAIYDALNYNTNFYDGVLIIYKDNNITSKNFDLFFEKKIGTIFGNVVYRNLNTTLYADKMDLDLITKNSKIYMLNKSKKIKIKNLN